ncbi:hypothetical protein SAMD00019534_025410, partial [Acytostelium subglobosum LB1]|uniref:hypothetical protein n=1 Tax=Acytostelium subglobosum LB1 TaxID=1410327 RepID=UPI000644BCD5
SIENDVQKTPQLKNCLFVHSTEIILHQEHRSADQGLPCQTRHCPNRPEIQCYIQGEDPSRGCQGANRAEKAPPGGSRRGYRFIRQLPHPRVDQAALNSKHPLI